MTVAENSDRLRDGGFPEDQVQAYIGEQAARLRAGGFPEEEIGEEIGKPVADHQGMFDVIQDRLSGLIDSFQLSAPDADEATLTRELEKNPLSIDLPPFMFDDFGRSELTRPDKLYNPHQLTVGQALTYGAAEQSLTGMFIHHFGERGTAEPSALPGDIDPEDLSFRDDFLIAMGELSGDLPAYIVGALSAFLTGGGPLIIGGTAFGITAATRSMVVDSYTRGSADTPEEFWLQYRRALQAGGKGAVVGVVTAGAGAVPRAFGAPVWKQLTSEIIALNASTAVVNQHLPTFREFMITSLALGGLKAGQLSVRAASHATRSKVNGYNAKKKTGFVGEITREEVPGRPGVGSIEITIDWRNIYDRLTDLFARTGKRPAEAWRDMQSDPSMKEDLLSLNQGMPRSYKPLENEMRDIETRATEPKAAPDVKPAEVAPVDAQYRQAVEAVIDSGNATPTVVQRSLRIGRNEADALLERMESDGIVGPEPPLHTGETRQLIVNSVLEALIERPVESPVSEEPVDVGVQEAIPRDPLEAGDANTFTEIAAEQPRGPAPPEPPPVEPPVEPPTPPSEGGPPRNLVRERIGKFEPPIDKGNVADFWANFYTNWYDKLYPRQRAKKALLKSVGKTEADLRISEDPYWLERLFVAVHMKSTSIAFRGPIDFDTYERVGPGLPEIYRPLGKGKKGFAQIPDFDDFLLARRAIELKGRGTVRRQVTDPKTKKKTVVIEDKIKTGVPIEDEIDPDIGVVVGLGAKSIVANAPEVFSKVAGSPTDTPEQAFGTVRTFQDHELRYAQKSGLLSEEVMDAMLELNLMYTPINRVIEAELRLGGFKVSSRRPIFQLKGSERLVISPTENILRNVYLLKAAADRNVIDQSFINLVKQSPIGDQFAVKKKPKIKHIRLTAKEIEKIGDKINKAVDADSTKAEIAEASKVIEGFVDIFRPQSQQLGKNEIAVYFDGEREVWEIKADALYRTWTAGTPRTNDIIARAFQFPAKLLRAGAILTPDFQVMNLPKDAIYAFFVDDFIPLVDSFRGVAALVTAREGGVGTRMGLELTGAVDRWMIAGGPMAELQSIDRIYFELTVKEMFYDTNLIRNYRNVMNPIAALQAISSASEQVTRLGMFIRAGGTKAQTKDALLEAGKRSREASLDFQKKGIIAEMLGRYASFYPVMVQGPERLFRAFRDRPGPTSARVFAGAIVPALTLYLLQKDEDWHKGINEHERDLFMHVGIGGTRHNPAVIIRIPRGHEGGLIFGRGAERLADFLLAEDPHAFDGFLTQLRKGIIDDVIMPFPQAILPVIETIPERGYSFFRDRPLIGLGMERFLPPLQYTPYTTELTKAMGDVLRFIPGLAESKVTSPVIIDNAINLWTGGLGRYMLRAADFMLRKSGVLPEGTVKPATQLRDIPGIGALFLRHPTLSDQRIIDFFETYDRNQKVFDTLEFLALQPGGAEASAEIRRIYGPEQVNPSGIRDMISDQNRILRDVNAVRGMDPIQKQQFIESQYRLILVLAKAGNFFMDKVREDTLKALKKQHGPISEGDLKRFKEQRQ